MYSLACVFYAIVFLREPWYDAPRQLGYIEQQLLADKRPTLLSCKGAEETSFVELLQRMWVKNPYEVRRGGEEEVEEASSGW